MKVKIHVREFETPYTKNVSESTAESEINGRSMYSDEAKCLRAFIKAEEIPDGIIDCDGDLWVLAKTNHKKKKSVYTYVYTEIEIIENEIIIRSDNDQILENSKAMDAVSTVMEDAGVAIHEDDLEGCALMENGRETGWVWSLKKPINK